MDLATLSRNSSLTPQTLTTAPYALQALLPVEGHYPRMRVYIEGDGHAWASRSQPSTDPTPLQSPMINLALLDAHPVAYLARPCQFVIDVHCSVEAWTAGRFGTAVLKAMNAGLDEIKRRYTVGRFELVGYSGGAAIALVLAATRQDVEQVQTLAGNVDPQFWTDLQGLEPLESPLLPLSWREPLSAIPQRHFVGLEDRVVPPAVVQSYVSKLKGRCVEVVTSNDSHSTGFEGGWTRYADLPIPCDLWNSGEPLKTTPAASTDTHHPAFRESPVRDGSPALPK